MAINLEVDLQSACYAVRDQGDRATCLACATSDAHAMQHGCPPLSSEYLFYHAIKAAKIGNLTDGIVFDEAAIALHQEGQPVETEWPYSMVHPIPWTPPAVTNIWRGTLQHSKVDAIKAIAAFIGSNQPVILGILLSSAFLAPTKPEFVISPAGGGFGGHAVLVVGLGRDEANLRYFRIRNSWGPAWADGGYAWLDANYLNDKLIGYASITAI